MNGEATKLTEGGREEDAVSCAEGRLMARVAERCGALMTTSCRDSSLPADFLAALVANESGGDANATRFEPAVYRHLEAVAAGFAAVYEGLDAQDLAAEEREMEPGKTDSYHRRALAAIETGRGETGLQGLDDAALRELATSWGYTQIMGYHMAGRGGTPRDLLNPRRHFCVAMELLSDFATQYHLDLGRDFAELFRCWNTGQPYGPPRGPATTDPDYVAKGLRRMALYARLPGESN
jgi:hypothetical protein